MFRLNDLILLLVIFVSMLMGVLLPCIGSLFQPFVLYLMMLLLFLSFLTIKMDTIYLTLKHAVGTIALVAVVKTIVLPIGIYSLFKVICPPLCPCGTPAIGHFNRRGGAFHFKRGKSQ